MTVYNDSMVYPVKSIIHTVKKRGIFPLSRGSVQRIRYLDMRKQPTRIIPTMFYEEDRQAQNIFRYMAGGEGAPKWTYEGIAFERQADGKTWKRKVNTFDSEASWTQPICQDCWPAWCIGVGQEVFEPHRAMVREDQAPEVCCACGGSTLDGIWIRANPVHVKRNLESIARRDERREREENGEYIPDPY